MACKLKFFISSEEEIIQFYENSLKVAKIRANTNKIKNP